jgi:hypothetical protein
VNKLSDELTRVLAEAGEGLKALQEDVITTGFDPDDPVSVEAATLKTKFTSLEVASSRG